MAKQLSLNWDLDSLNKAYRQGYMAGIMGMAPEQCPYRGEVIVASWEAGWEDGREDYQRRTRRQKSA